MSRLPLRSILPDFLTSVARVLLGTLRDGLKKSTNLVSKFSAIFGDVLASLSARHLSDGAPTACTYTVSGSFSLPRRVLFAFPSRYWFTIGQSGVFSLGGWSPHIQTG